MTLDQGEEIAEMRQLIRKYDLRYPVLHCDDTGAPGAGNQPCGWNITSLSRTYWIDPQGNIITRTGIRETETGERDYRPLLAELDWLKAHWPALPIIYMGLQPELHAGGGLTLTVQVSSSTHTPLDVYFGGIWRWPRGSDNAEALVWPEDDSSIRHVQFGEFGDFSFSVQSPAIPGVRGVYLYTYVNFPGTECLNNGDGLLMVTDRDVWLTATAEADAE